MYKRYGIQSKTKIQGTYTIIRIEEPINLRTIDYEITSRSIICCKIVSNQLEMVISFKAENIKTINKCHNRYNYTIIDSGSL